MEEAKTLNGLGPFLANSQEASLVVQPYLSLPENDVGAVIEKAPFSHTALP